MGCFAAKSADLVKKEASFRKIIKSTEGLFADSATKSRHENAQVLWSEASGGVEKGWLLPPFLHPIEGKPFLLRGHKLNVSFRFGDKQSDKIRDCDDLRFPKSNLDFVAETQIKISIWAKWLKSHT